MTPHELDTRDPLRPLRSLFEIPTGAGGEPLIYLCGNSLGLMPKVARELVNEELSDWAELAVEGHFRAKRPWFSYHELFREQGAALVGARPGEVVMMNTLTVNLHLMLTTFYRPEGKRTKILIDAPTFPSDRFAVQSQVKAHGFDPATHLLAAGPNAVAVVDDDAVVAAIERHADEVSVILLSGVNYLTGQWFDIPRAVAAGREAGCIVGLDLAHAAGNVPLELHAWDVDFAVWCNYKYLNSGPGAVGGCFVHERHGRNLSLPRFAGWWGNDPATRFEMQQHLDFVPREGADGWQLSNPPILSLAPVKASLDIFEDVGMPAIREKSMALTGFLEDQLQTVLSDRIELITPSAPNRRGCQLSLRIRDHAPRRLFDALRDRGVVADFRDPDVIRVAPAPLYNSFADVARFVEVLADVSQGVEGAV